MRLWLSSPPRKKRRQERRLRPFDADGRPRPSVPAEPPAPVPDAQLADNLTDLTTVVGEAEDVENKERFMKQADRLVRQYCRLSVIPTNETAVTEELRSMGRRRRNSHEPMKFV